MEPRVDNLAKFYMMLALAEGPKHGYELITGIGKRTGKRASPGQVYPFLRLLAEERLVRVRREKRKKVYALTAKGRTFSRRLFERFGGLIELAVRPQLCVCVHCRCEVYKGGYVEHGQEFCCRACAAAHNKG